MFNIYDTYNVFLIRSKFINGNLKGILKIADV